MAERCLFKQHRVVITRGLLYAKETKSYFEIENIEKTYLIVLQNRIVDPRFREFDYREIQSYVGESVAWQREKAHFASPKPEDLNSLMGGLIATYIHQFGVPESASSTIG